MVVIVARRATCLSLTRCLGYFRSPRSGSIRKWTIPFETGCCVSHGGPAGRNPCEPPSYPPCRLSKITRNAGFYCQAPTRGQQEPLLPRQQWLMCNGIRRPATAGSASAGVTLLVVVSGFTSTRAVSRTHSAQTSRASLLATATKTKVTWHPPRTSSTRRCSQESGCPVRRRGAAATPRHGDCGQAGTIGSGRRVC